MNILIKPIITEKANNDSELNSRYTFVVDGRANKLQISDAVEKAYGITVRKVRTLNYPVQRKKKHTKKGVVVGIKGSYKKAVVQLADGDSIDFYKDV